MPEFVLGCNPEGILSIIIVTYFSHEKVKIPLSPQKITRGKKENMAKSCIFGKITGCLFTFCYSCPLACNFAIPPLKFPTSLHEQRKKTLPLLIRKKNLGGGP